MPTHPKQVCGLYYFRCIGGVTMEPVEYNGFMIADAPGQMFKATKIVPSPYFKGPLNACSIDSLKMIEDAGYSGQVIRAQMYRDLFGAKSSQDKKNLTSFTVKNKRAFTMINTETDVA